MTARSPEYLSLQRRYNQITARIVRRSKRLPEGGVPAAGEEAAFDVTLAELHALAREMHSILGQAEIVVGIEDGVQKIETELKEIEQTLAAVRHAGPSTT